MCVEARRTRDRSGRDAEIRYLLILSGPCRSAEHAPHPINPAFISEKRNVHKGLQGGQKSSPRRQQLVYDLMYHFRLHSAYSYALVFFRSGEGRTDEQATTKA